MKNISKLRSRDVELVERLSKLDVKEADYYTRQFNKTLSIIGEINALDTEKVTPTNHVTDLTNVFREDEVDKNRILAKEEALSGSNCVHNGYFMVKAVFDDE